MRHHVFYFAVALSTTLAIGVIVILLFLREHEPVAAVKTSFPGLP